MSNLITDRELNEVFGVAKNDGGASLVKFKPPYPLYYDGKPVSGVRCHNKVAGALESALKAVLEHYGSAEIKRLRLDVYGGCYIYRFKRGSKTVLSRHSWAVAFDFDPANNDLKMKAPQAHFSRPEYKPFIDIMESHGFANLGKYQGFDWMHFEPKAGFFR